MRKCLSEIDKALHFTVHHDVNAILEEVPRRRGDADVGEENEIIGDDSDLVKAAPEVMERADEDAGGRQSAEEEEHLLQEWTPRAQVESGDCHEGYRLPGRFFDLVQLNSRHPQTRLLALLLCLNKSISIVTLFWKKKKSK